MFKTFSKDRGGFTINKNVVTFFSQITWLIFLYLDLQYLNVKLRFDGTNNHSFSITDTLLHFYAFNFDAVKVPLRNNTLHTSRISFVINKNPFDVVISIVSISYTSFICKYLPANMYRQKERTYVNRKMSKTNTKEKWMMTPSP